MDILSATQPYETLRVRVDAQTCFIRLDRPQDNNTISQQMIEELGQVLAMCEQAASIVVVEGSPEVFCLGADFKEIHRGSREVGGGAGQDPASLYNVWLRLAAGPFVSVAHVRGRVNAGGIGFVAACDVVLSEAKAIFSLSELLFGLMPACVLPFLIRRIGMSRSNYMTLMTRAIPARQALEWGLVDACEDDSANLLRKHLLQLRRLTKEAVIRYKRYMGGLGDELLGCRDRAIQANCEIFADRGNLENISRYVQTGRFPWEASH